MIEYVQEYIVRDEARGQFELVYGPGGAWSNLFGRCAGFRGAGLVRDVNDRRRYLVLEIWTGEDLREQATIDRAAEWAALDARLAGLAESRRELGTFKILAEATVRAAPRRGRPG